MIGGLTPLLESSKLGEYEDKLVHQPSYIGGSARLWHFTSRHGS